MQILKNYYRGKEPVEIITDFAALSGYMHVGVEYKGEIYFVPYGAQKEFAKINMRTGTVTKFLNVNTHVWPQYAANYSFAGATVVGNEMFCFQQYGVKHSLKINLDTLAVTALPDFNYKFNAFFGQIFHPTTQKIYCAPLKMNNKWLEYDPATDTVVRFGTQTGAANQRYGGEIAYCPDNDHLYATPYPWGAGTFPVAEVDVSGPTETVIGHLTYATGDAAYSHVTNKIYTFPLGNAGITEIDPVTHTMAKTPGSSALTAHPYGNEAPNHKMYLAPTPAASKIAEYTPLTDTVNTLPDIIAGGYMGVCVGSDGSLYLTPSATATHVVKIANAL